MKGKYSGGWNVLYACTCTNRHTYMRWSTTVKYEADRKCLMVREGVVTSNERVSKKVSGGEGEENTGLPTATCNLV